MATTTDAPLEAARRVSRLTEQRGGVAVEAVIVVLFLVIAFYCVVGIGGLYKAKLLAMQDSRFEAVHNAVNNCDIAGRASASLGAPSILDGMPPTPAESSPTFGIDFERTVQGGAGVSLAQSSGQFSFGTTPSASPAGGPTQAALFTPISGRVSSRSYMFCNEKAVGFNLLEYLDRAIDDFTQSVGALPALAERAIGR